MADGSIMGRVWPRFPFRHPGLREQDLAVVDRYVREALIENKRTGLLLAVRARWIALAVTAVLMPILEPDWGVLYYEAAVILFALIGWAQLRVGKVAQSRRELFLIFCDLALFTFFSGRPQPVLQRELAHGVPVPACRVQLSVYLSCDWNAGLFLAHAIRLRLVDPGPVGDCGDRSRPVRHRNPRSVGKGGRGVRGLSGNPCGSSIPTTRTFPHAYRRSSFF